MSIEKANSLIRVVNFSSKFPVIQIEPIKDQNVTNIKLILTWKRALMKYYPATNGLKYSLIGKLTLFNLNPLSALECLVSSFS